MQGKELVIAWLNDAHAMENALVQVLQHRIKDAEGFPELQEMDRQHLEETKRHAAMVKGCISRVGEKPSLVKSLIGTMFGAVQAPMTEFARDEVVKNCLMDHAAEQFEVASYASLIAAANEIGDTETARVCEQIMREDEAMAGRIMASIPMVTTMHMANLARQDTGQVVAGMSGADAQTELGAGA